MKRMDAGLAGLLLGSALRALGGEDMDSSKVQFRSHAGRSTNAPPVIMIDTDSTNVIPTNAWTQAEQNLFGPKASWSQAVSWIEPGCIFDSRTATTTNAWRVLLVTNGVVTVQRLSDWEAPAADRGKRIAIDQPDLNNPDRSQNATPPLP